MRLRLSIICAALCLIDSSPADEVNFHHAYYGQHVDKGQSNIATALNALRFGSKRFQALHQVLESEEETRLDRTRRVRNDFEGFSRKQNLPPVNIYSNWVTNHFASKSGDVHLNLETIHLQGDEILDEFYTKLRSSVGNDIRVILVLDHYAVEDSGVGNMRWVRRNRHYVLAFDWIRGTKDRFGFMVSILDPAHSSSELLKAYIIKRGGNSLARMGESKEDDKWIDLSKEHLTISGYQLDTGSSDSWAQRQCVVPAWAILRKYEGNELEPNKEEQVSEE